MLNGLHDEASRGRHPAHLAESLVYAIHQVTSFALEVAQTCTQTLFYSLSQFQTLYNGPRNYTETPRCRSVGHRNVLCGLCTVSAGTHQMQRVNFSIRNALVVDWDAILAHDILVLLQRGASHPSVSLWYLPEALQMSIDGTCWRATSQGPANRSILTLAPNVVQDPMDTGEARLKALGYKQELKRDFTLVSNTAISFSIISTLLGITGICRSPSATHAASSCQSSDSSSHFHKGCAVPPAT